MSLWKQWAGLSLGVAALVTFRFLRQLQEQKHHLEVELERCSNAYQRTQLKQLRELQEQLETNRQEHLKINRHLQEQNHGLEGELEIRSGMILQLQEQLEINRQEQLENLQVKFPW
jgi:hypothetical protein